MPIQPISAQDFNKEVLEEEKPVLVDFYAEWCGPCKIAGPILDKLADEFNQKVKIVKLDVDQEADLAQKYQVMSIPTVLVFKNGKEIERKVGFPGEEGYRAMVENLKE